jgi:hypothetical protein
MKQCQQCGVLTEDEKSVCRNCRASLENEPSLPEPPKQPSVFFPVMGISFCLVVTFLAFALHAWRPMLIVGAIGLCVSFFGCVSYLWRSPRDEAGHDNGLVIFLCVAGIFLSLFAVVFGGCALILP